PGRRRPAEVGPRGGPELHRRGDRPPARARPDRRRYLRHRPPQPDRIRVRERRSFGRPPRRPRPGDDAAAAGRLPQELERPAGGTPVADPETRPRPQVPELRAAARGPGLETVP